jgi:hypothetical protein
MSQKAASGIGRPFDVQKNGTLILVGHLICQKVDMSYRPII